MTRRRKNKRNAERARRKEFYEGALRDGLGSTAQSDGAASEAAKEAARTEADEREVKRVARDLLYTQPADTDLVMKSSRLLMPDPKNKADRNKKKELADNLAEVLNSLGDQLLPEGRHRNVDPGQRDADGELGGTSG